MKSSAFFILLIAVSITGCSRNELPEPGSDAYREAVSAFYVGVTALQAGETLGAEDQLIKVTEIVPQEPAAWINLGILAMRQNDFELATERLARAKESAPDNGTVELVLGRLASAQGNFEEAIQHFRRARELEPENKQAAYALVQELQRQADPATEQEIQQILEGILESHPENLAVLLDVARIASRRGDMETLERALSEIVSESSTFPPEIQEQIRGVEQVLAENQTGAIETQVAFLRNMLVRLPRFRQDLAEVQVPSEDMAELVDGFMRLPSPPPNPAPADTGLTFVVEPFPFAEGGWNWAKAFVLGLETPPSVVLANNRSLQPAEGQVLPFPGGVEGTRPPVHAIIPVDYNYDFRMDLAVVGQGGFRFYRQEEDGSFLDVTTQIGVPAAVTQAPYTAVWAADLDLEGDMDLILAPPEGEPVTLMNNADGTFTTSQIFNVQAVCGFTWSDYDADGDPDATILDDSGNLHFFTNLRGGLFRELREPLPGVAAHAVADINSDAILDVVVLEQGGSLRRASYLMEEEDWVLEDLSTWSSPSGEITAASSVLYIADLDNNGALDVLASRPEGGFIWLGNEQNIPEAFETIEQAYILSISDLNGDGKLDLTGVTESGTPVMLVNQSPAGYQYKQLRTRAAETFGEQRINTYGIGGEVEIRSGLLFQKQIINEPIIHFGLGRNIQADAARIIWPNGSVQAEFDLVSGQAVMASQRLKGSCPWLFTFDGEQMQFVTDFIWRSPLGLKINAQETAGILTTEDWVKIRSDQLKPHDGYYDIRITADLWETHFFDHVSLMVVDHPEDTEVFIDERFAFPPPELKVHVTGSLQPIKQAWDHRGQEVTEIVLQRDEQYLGGFPLTSYQGIAQDHYVEVLLGENVPDKPVYLIAHGWLRPTDSSINVAISQGSHNPPQGLSLEVPDGKGGWRIARSNLGSPAGKTKTILIDLDGIFSPGQERRLRLRTTMEIYWDSFNWAEALPQAELQSKRLLAETADLRYRGFSLVTEANRNSPEIPHYDRLNGTGQFWRDLEGYYTRFGDIRELLTEVDDRYVIMNAGDEMIFRFTAPVDPPEGWKRDFVLIGDGWVKDGDYNTAFSKTVLPLPSHTRAEYDIPPSRLEDDPIYQKHQQDWVNYHTRYIGSERFQQAMLPSSRE